MAEETATKKTKLGDPQTLVREQVEYYFGDSNFRRDKWMKTTTSENGGYIPVSKLLDFKKLSHILADHGKDLAFLVESVADSDVVELSEDKTLIKRKHPLPEVDDSKERTLVVTGLPKDSTLTTIDSVKEFFSQLGTVNSVSVQKNKEKELTGSAYVEFNNVDEAKALSEKADVTFEGSVLTFKVKSVHDEERKNLRQQEKDKKKAEDRKKDIVRGVLVKFNTEPFSEMEPIEIRKFFTEKYGNVKFVDTNPSNGEKTGFIRFTDVDSCKSAMASIEAKECVYNDKAIEASLVEGDEEETYWNEKVLSSTQQKKKKRKR